LERTWLQKEKTWQFTWSYAINPFNGKKIPIYIWDYVLAWYGTWVVMAVPAHDERDYDFAKKYNIPIDFVIGNTYWEKNPDAQAKKSWYWLVYDERDGTILLNLCWDGKYTNPWWTIEEWETDLQWTIREIKEETWYNDFSFVAELACAQSFYYVSRKETWRENNAKYFLFKLNSDSQQPKNLTEFESDYKCVKVTIDEFKKYLQWEIANGNYYARANLDAVIALEKYLAGENIAYTEKWILFNSWEFSGLTSNEAIAKMQEWLAEKWIGWKKVNYRLQDWVFSRQRYWWEPIPMIHCPNCGIVPLTEDDLPLTLPDVENYEPTGTEEWPLANIHEWMNVKCPHCGADAKRESNTMPGWAGSSRYWIRYMDPHNDKQLVAPEKEKFWHPVDMYVWWAEHINRHLIYARFRNMFLYDMGITSLQEPFKAYQSVWLIMAEDGRKMSKRRGNVVNPDDIVNEYGADTLRVYEMFMWPFDQAVSWNTNGVKWVKKFLDRVCNLYPKIAENYEDDKKILMTLHQTIKKVDEDISNRFGFNTAIAQMMILVNELTWVEKISKNTFQTLIILLAPFAPHLAEEFREKLGNQFSIFDGKNRPEVDEKYLQQDTITMAVQVNGKVRWTIEISKTATQDEVMEVIRNDEKISRNLVSEIKKVIYIPWKICNIVL
jgi:leucyl-tRNA synthetase